jgi:methylenetetrahydrofolate reductase (NADPH)
MLPCPYLIELLTPKIPTPEVSVEKMNLFAERYCRILDSGNALSIPDNPMGQPRVGALEAIDFCGLSLDPQRIVMNLNTFHSKKALDGMLTRAAELGLMYLLVVRGDGGPEHQKLDPQGIGGKANVATSIDLIRYINATYSGKFITGAAYNQYNRMPFETERLGKKIAAGARFVVTQPVIGKDSNVESLAEFGIPVIVEAWMSENVDLLYKSVRKAPGEQAEGYDPVENLKAIHSAYPENCVYLSMLSFKKDWNTLLPRL